MYLRWELLKAAGIATGSVLVHAAPLYAGMDLVEKLWVL